MFPDRLKKLRLDRNLTRDAFAPVFGVVSKTVYMWETGERKPDITTLAKLAQYFGVTSDYLLGLSDDPNGSIHVPAPTTIAAHQAEGMPPVSQDRLDDIIAQAVELIKLEAAKQTKKPEE